ncbi:hypothetical protein Dimus_016045 [Dionaea muscipula]
MPPPTINRRSHHWSRRPAGAQPPQPLCRTRSQICTALTIEEKTMTEVEASYRLHLHPKPKSTTARMMTEEAGGDVHHRWKQEEGDDAVIGNDDAWVSLAHHCCRQWWWWGLVVDELKFAGVAGGGAGLGFDGQWLTAYKWWLKTTSVETTGSGGIDDDESDMQQRRVGGLWSGGGKC